MDIMVIYAIIMGIVEGITEFLPVSSTGHLIMMDKFLNFQGPPGKVFEITIQLGSILSICWLFRAKLWDVAKNLPRERKAQGFTINLLIAFLPAAVLGLLFHHFITEHLFNVRVVASTMVIGGILIILIEKSKLVPRIASVDNISPKLAFLIGCCQTLAMVPGVSRSGATIMGALLLGVERKAAAEFSFFLAIPTMFAATLFDIFKNRAELTADGLTLLAIGFGVAFITALVFVRWFIAFISKHNFIPFAWYRIVVGTLAWVTLVACGV